MPDGKYKDGFLDTAKGTMVDSSAVAYALKDSGAIDGKVSRSRIDSYDKVWYIAKDKVIVAVVVQNDAVPWRSWNWRLYSSMALQEQRMPSLLQ